MKDFIYIDTDAISSISAQLFEGIYLNLQMNKQSIKEKTSQIITEQMKAKRQQVNLAQVEQALLKRMKINLMKANQLNLLTMKHLKQVLKSL